MLETIKIKKLNANATVPTRSHPTDAGLDLYASEDVIVTRGAKIPTGIAVDIPEGYEGTIRPRSGLTYISPLRVQIGTIDAKYSGELGILADCYPTEFERGGDRDYELTPLRYRVTKGEKIAQLVISPIETPTVEVVAEFDSESMRGENGFGSSGY